MPPKPKNTREEIVAAAIECIRRWGQNGLTAKQIGQVLGSAPSSIFTHFASMEELTQETVHAVWQDFDRRIRESMQGEAPFLDFPAWVVHYAGEEPNLFALLFMSPGRMEDPDLHSAAQSSWEEGVRVLQRCFCLQEPEAQRLFRDIYLYTKGMAVSVAAGAMSMTADAVYGALRRVYRGFLMSMMTPTDAGKNKTSGPKDETEGNTVTHPNRKERGL